MTILQILRGIGREDESYLSSVYACLPLAIEKFCVVKIFS